MNLRNSQTNSENTEQNQPSHKHCFLQERIKDFLAFQRTCQPLSTGYVELLSFILVLHSFLGYLLLSKHYLSEVTTQIVDSIRSSEVLSPIIQTLIFILNIILVCCLCSANQKYKMKIWFSTVKRLISLYSLLVKISLFLTSLSLYLKWELNIIPMILSGFCTIFENLFMENYCLRKKQNYQSSQSLSLIRTIGIITLLLTNTAIYRFNGHLNVYLAATLLFSILTFFWHYFGGYKLYLHSAPRMLLLFFCAGIISSGLIALTLITSGSKKTSFSMLQLLISFSASLFYLSQFQKKNRFQFDNIDVIISQQKRLKDYELNLSILLEQSQNNKSKENLLLGIISNSYKNCLNNTCSFKQTVVFDPYLRKEFNHQELIKEKQSGLKFYLKCTYAKALALKKCKQLMIDYTEFSVSEMGDFSTHCLIIDQLGNSEGLSFLEKIKLCQLKLIIKEQSQAFNRLLYGGKIQLSEVIASEQTYDLIMKDIDDFCERNVEIWTNCLQLEVNVSELKEQFSQNFQLVENINHKWQSMVKFLPIQKRWKHIYLNFALYLKNEKIKNRDIAEDAINTQQPLENEEISPLNDSKKHQNISSNQFFDKKSAIIMCYLSSRELLFEKVSKSFQELTGYADKEIIGSHLQIILPRHLRQSHNKIVNSWVQSGRTTDESSFYVKHTHFVNKQEQEVTSIVIFKQYIDLLSPGRFLKFICLLNSEQKEGKKRLTFSQTTDLTKIKHTSSQLLLKQRVQIDNNLSLNATNNIFIKDDNLQPVTQIDQISKTKIGMRLITFVLIVLFIWLSLIIQKDITHLSDHGKEIIIFCNLYNLPLVLAKYYFNLVAKQGPPSTMESNIYQVSKELEKYQHQSFVTQVLYDEKLNIPNAYPPYQINSVNESIVFSNVDIYFVIYSCLTTLSKHPPKQMTHDLNLLDSYIVPGYDNMLNSTKNQLHFEMQEEVSRIAFVQLIILIILSLVLILSGIYLSYKIYDYYRNMKEVVDIMVQLNKKQIHKIISHWQRVKEYFQTLNCLKPHEKLQEHVEIALSEKEQNQEKQSNSNGNSASLNQKHKSLVYSHGEKRKIIKNNILTAILIGAFLIIVISWYLVTTRNLNQIAAFEEEGNTLIKFFPVTSVVGYAIAKAYHEQVYPQATPFNYTRFRPTLSTLKFVRNFPFIDNFESESVYSNKLRNYLFGNPCAYSTDVLNKYKQSFDTCSTIANRSFSNGIVTYLRYAYPLIRKYLENKSVISATDIKDLSIGLTLSGYYFADAIQSWYDQFATMLTSFCQKALCLSLLFCLIFLLLHLFLFEVVVLSSLRRDYKFMRMMFSLGMPEYILTSQKVIKHRFFRSGILKSN